MPGGRDAELLILDASWCSWVLIYVDSSTIGSRSSCVGLYKISERAGHRALNRFSEKKQKRVKDLIDRYDVLSVLVASVLPPPFPFKLFVVTAVAVRLDLFLFTIARARCRTVRHLLPG